MSHEHAPQSTDGSEALLNHLFGTTEELKRESDRAMKELGLRMRQPDEEGGVHFD